jgi:hypothetical protein
MTMMMQPEPQKQTQQMWTPLESRDPFAMRVRPTLQSWRDVGSLSQINGLEPLEDICKRFNIELTAHGSTVRRLVSRGNTSIFDLAPFTSDLDLVHSAGPDKTASIKAAILSEVPFGEALRLELHDASTAKAYRVAAAHSGIIPALTLRLGTQTDGIVDTWHGIDDIERRTYRFIKNGFFRDSPLYAAGRDLDLMSALLYLRVALDDDLDERLINQPGLNSAELVIRETTSNSDALTRLARFPELVARLTYQLLGVRFAQPNALTDDAPSFEALSMNTLRTYLAQNSQMSTIFDSIFSASDEIGASRTMSAHLGGSQFRFAIKQDERWTFNREELVESLLATVSVFREAIVTSAEAPTMDEGLTAVAGSPFMPIRPGVSTSSGKDSDEAGVQEFAHFQVLAGMEGHVQTRASEDLSVIAVVFEGDVLKWVTTVPSHCEMRPIGGFVYLHIRCNLGSMCSAVSDGMLRLFVLGWDGRESEMRAL